MTDSKLPSLKSGSVDQSLEAGDTIFSSGRSKNRKHRDSVTGSGQVKLPRLINNKSLNDGEDTIITIDQTQDSSHMMHFRRASKDESQAIITD